jgi:hypothetical protein
MEKSTEDFMGSYIVSCSACGTDNRIPAEMEGKKGRCGSCRADLPPLYFRPHPLTDSSFNDFITNYPGPVLAEFWAPG